MSDYDFDLFVIGAGSGGVAASRRAAEYGARVAICEADRVGGTCVLRGCVPKKLLVYASKFSHDFHDAQGFGWEVGSVRLDWARLIEAKNRELDRLNGIYLRMLADAGVALIEGRGEIVGPEQVKVGERTFRCKDILIATGGAPTIPDIPGAELGITSNEALDLPELPQKVTIIGGGYIGVEFAGIFNGAGCDVTMLIRGDEILRGFDRDIRSCLTAEMRAAGIKIESETLVRSIARKDGRLSLRLAGEDLCETDLVLFATGRHPNTRGLGLESVGIRCDEWGCIEVDEWSATSVPGIFAVGDVTSRAALTPVAIADGRAFAETRYHQNPSPVDHENIATAVFSQPAVGTVGLTEDEARRKCEHIDVYRAHFRPMKNTLGGRTDKILMKLIVDKKDDRVLGCHIVGDDGPEIIQAVAVAIKCGATKKQFDATMAIHPTAAEELVTMRDPIPDTAYRPPPHR